MPCHICTSANHSFLACPSFNPVNNTRPTRTPPGRPTVTNCRGFRMVSTSWETQSDSRTLWKVLKEPCHVHQPQSDSYADFPPPPPSLLGNILIFMTALSSSSASPPPVSPYPHDSSPPPVSPCPHESPQAASTTTRKKNQPYRKETVDEAILVYTALKQRLSLGETLTKALREAGISYPTFQRLHRPLGEASVLIPSSVANIGLVFKVIKGVSAELQKVPECQRKEATDAGLII